MDAVILAGGFGTRLREYVSEVPKPMAAINGSPFLEILLKDLVRKKITRTIISIGYLGDVIQRHFGSEYEGMKLEYSAETKPLGTGGAIKKALELVESGTALVMNGDSYVDFDLQEINMAFNSHNEPICLVREVEDTSRFGIIQTLNGRITHFGEKSEAGPGFINAGVYLLPKDIFLSKSLPEIFSFENDYLRTAVEERSFVALEAHGLFIDIGVPEDFIRAQTLLRHL